MLAAGTSGAGEHRVADSAPKHHQQISATLAPRGSFSSRRAASRRRAVAAHMRFRAAGGGVAGGEKRVKRDLRDVCWQ